jgi:PAS domain S-box-containing protein
MNPSNDEPGSQGLQQNPVSQSHQLSSIDPYSLLGLSVALIMYDREEDVAQFIASAVTAALRLKLGAVALRNSEGDKLCVFGQLGLEPLENSLAQELEDFVSVSPTGSEALSADSIREIELPVERLPKLSAAGVDRFLLARLRTLDTDFGLMLAGKSSEEPYLPHQTASLLTLAGQTSLALHRIRLSKEQEFKDIALKESEARHRAIVDTAADGILTIDQHGAIESLNGAAEQIFGYSATEILGQNVKILMPEPYSSEHDQHIADYLKSGEKKIIGIGREVVGRRKDGTIFPMYIAVSEVHLGEQQMFTGIVRDITKLKRAEQAVRESEERLSRILESTMDAIIAINAKRTIVLFNQAAEKVFGCTTTEAVGQRLDDYLSEGFSNLLTDYLAEFRKGKKTQRYMWAPEGLTARRAGGEEFPIEATIAQFETAGNKFFTIILRDINERKMAEQELRKLQMEKMYLQEEIKAEYDFEQIVGDSGSIKKVFQDIESVAKTNATVLVTGETGTGKELIARAIHNLSLRNEKVMVKVNCSALPSGLVESELFGHEKGAFTGALSQKIGRFELANGGSIFLDEIGDLPLELQAKLLRVLQEGELERVGGSETIKVNVRIIAATNRHLGKAIEDGSFRADLYYRLNVFPIHIPPLRERREDVRSLVRHFVMKHGMAMGKRIKTIPQKVMQALVSYSWPGNVRELGNLIERAVIISHGNRLELGDWLPRNGVSSDPTTISTLEELEKGHIIEVLELTGWRVSGEKGAARILGMKPTTLESRMKKLGIER